jgi:hypothetical protein
MTGSVLNLDQNDMPIMPSKLFKLHSSNNCWEYNSPLGLPLMPARFSININWVYSMWIRAALIVVQRTPRIVFSASLELILTKV